ncbi:MAG: hypothetical protein ACK40E_00330 [Caldimicrobium sp.]
MSLEFRLIAEDTKRGFLPLSGVITNFSYKSHPWLTMRTHVPQDKPYVIPTQYDPNLALAIIYAENLGDLLEKSRTFLSELKIEGYTLKKEPLATNIDYLEENLDKLYQFLPS